MTTQFQPTFRPGRRGRVARRLLGTLGLASLAAAGQAQEPLCEPEDNGRCLAGETEVVCPVGEISSYPVPENVQALRITAAGAKGGDQTQLGIAGGPGGVLTGTAEVSVDDELRVLVGTAGESDFSFSGGGGGGSFVGVGMGNDAFSADNLLVVAGGGGGAGEGNGGAGGTLDGAVGEAGGGSEGGGGGAENGDGGEGGVGPVPGSDGGGATEDGEGGGNVSSGGGGGAGGNGGSGDNGTGGGGLAAVNGGTGGGTVLGGGGGFGGGGGGSWGAGGGGGYAGGGGGGGSGGSPDLGAGGGGGSSFFADEVNDTSSAATNESDGLVFLCEITQLETDLAIAKTATVGADGTTVTFDLEVENLGLFNAAEAVFDLDVVPALPQFALVLLIALLSFVAVHTLRRSNA